MAADTVEVSCKTYVALAKAMGTKVEMAHNAAGDLGIALGGPDGSFIAVPVASLGPTPFEVLFAVLAGRDPWSD